MYRQHEVEMLMSGTAAVLATVGSAVAQMQSPDISILGSLLQVGAAGCVLYTVRLFLQDRREREASLRDERKDREAQVSEDRREHLTYVADSIQQLRTVTEKLELATNAMQGAAVRLVEKLSDITDREEKS